MRWQWQVRNCTITPDREWAFICDSIRLRPSKKKMKGPQRDGGKNAELMRAEDFSDDVDRNWQKSSAGS
jgi:hypothetical protein